MTVDLRHPSRPYDLIVEWHDNVEARTRHDWVRVTAGSRLLAISEAEHACREMYDLGPEREVKAVHDPESPLG